MLGDPEADDYVMLDATHLGREVIAKKLPDIAEFCRVYQAVDPADQPIPVQPTAHYAMGGIPTSLDGEVIVDGVGGRCAGLYAAGECACVSVHGANRLGTNSLVDLIVFGRRAGQHMADAVAGADAAALPADAGGPARKRIEELLKGGGGPADADGLRSRMRDTMMDNVGIYRTDAALAQAEEDVRTLRRDAGRLRIGDRARRFNSELLELLELQNLLDLSLVTAASARHRLETRGAHAREDYPARDDNRFLNHTLAWLEGDDVCFGQRPVDLSKWEPKPRKY
jgi:succinate dehydrogenase / fumarate reductase flavoprotein subunit